MSWACLSTILNFPHMTPQQAFTVNNAATTVNPACNRRARIRHRCRKTTAISGHRCLINTGVEKMNNI